MLFNNTTCLCILYTLLSVIISILQQQKKQKTTQLLKFLIKYVNNKPLGEYYK